MRDRTSEPSADLAMKSFAPALAARFLFASSRLPEIATTGSSRMRGSLELRMRSSSSKPSSFGISRSVNTMTIDGSVLIASQPASPSASSRTANDALRMLANVLRTNFESSMTSTRLSGRSVGFPRLFRQVDDDPAIHLPLYEIVERRGQLAEPNRTAHLLEQRRPHVRGEPAPDLAAQLGAGTLGRVDAEQAHAAQDEWQHRRVEVRARGEANRRDHAVHLHRARYPSEDLSAEVVDGAGPGCLVQGFDSLQIQVLSQKNFPGAQLFQPVGFAFLPGERDDVIAELGQRRNGDRADAAGGAVHDHLPALRLEPVLLHAHDTDAGGEAGGAERHRVPQRHSLRQLGEPFGWHARVLRVAAVMRDAEVIAHGEHRVSLGEARVARRNDGAGEVDAADARRAAQDLAFAGGGERVLVVDVRVRHAHHDLARIQLVERALDEFRANLPVRRFSELVCLELVHWPSCARSAGNRTTASRGGGSPRGRTPRFDSPPGTAPRAAPRPIR